MKKTTLIVTTILIFTACSNQEQIRYINKQMSDINKTKNTKNHILPKPPKKHIKLKKVEDENFSSDYMYPNTNNSKPKKNLTKNLEINQTKEELHSVAKYSVMTKEECISIIGQEKFENYTQMYGDTNLALKKCKMLKEL